MEKTLEEIRNFLKQHQTIYGSTLYLEGRLSSRALAEVKPQRISQTPQVLKKRPALLKQKSPALQAYYEEIKDCRKCSLADSRKNFVFGYGHPNAKVMFIGEAPGRDEDEQGLPFVGPAGKLLDKMLQAINLNREDIFIANVLKCRPPRNRDPLPEEVAACEPYLLRQLQMIAPQVLVALGRVAGQTLLRSSNSLSELRQTVHTYNNIPLLITYHPAALLRNPRWKQSSWQDLKRLRAMLGTS